MNDSSAALTSRADVATDTPERYAKQLASHLGRKLEIQEDDGGTRVIFPDGGDCLMTSDDGVLELRAQAQDTAELDHVEDVVGRHLEKFGTRAGLVVTWVR